MSARARASRRRAASANNRRIVGVWSWESRSRNAVVRAAAGIVTAAGSAGEALLAACASVRDTLATWLGWGGADEEHEPRSPAGVTLRAVAGGASAPARRSEPLQPAPRSFAPEPEAAARPLPVVDERDEVTVLVREPSAVFVFWTMSRETAERRERLRASSPGAPARDALQVEVELEGDRDAGASGATATESTWLVALPPRAGSAHVDLRRPRQRVRVTLGLASDEGFVPLVSSAPIALPAATPAPIAAPRWRRIDDAITDGDPPAAPPAEAVEKLTARAAECDTATSSTLPIAHHLLGLERGTGVVAR